MLLTIIIACGCFFLGYLVCALIVASPDSDEVSKKIEESMKKPKS